MYIYQLMKPCFEECVDVSQLMKEPRNEECVDDILQLKKNHVMKTV